MGSVTDTFIFDAVWQRDVPLTPRIFFGARRYNNNNSSHGFPPRTAVIPGGRVAIRGRRPQPGKSDQQMSNRQQQRCAGSPPTSWRDIFVAPAACGPVPKLGVNFLRAAQDTTIIKYALAGCQSNPLTDDPGESATLTLGQDLRNLGLGAVLWDCGEDLTAFLGQRRQLVTGKRVLDLGTGTGVAGLAAARCGARDVTLTDHRAMGALVRSNVERNAAGFTAAGCCRPSFVPFSWDDHTAEEVDKLARSEDPFDIVLASDCLYDSSMVDAFRRALASTCGPRTVLIMAYKRRLDSREKKFFARLEEDFDLEVVGSPSNEPPATSKDFTEEMSSGVIGVDPDRGVYLLLGARRPRGHATGRPSPLDKWRLNGWSRSEC